MLFKRPKRKKPPTRIGRPPTPTGRLRLPPTKAKQKLVPKPKAVTVTGKKPPAPKPKRTHGDPIPKRRVPKKDITKGKPTGATIDYFKDGKRFVKSVEPDSRTPRPKRPTRDGVKTDAGITRPDRRRPPRTPTPKKPPRTKRPLPKNIQAFIEELRRKQKVKRPPRPPKNEVGLPVTKGPDAPVIRPPRQPIRPGLTDPSGRPIQPRVPRRPPNNVEKFLAGRKPNELNRQDKIRFTKELYKFNKERQQRNIDQARQQIIERFRNDPARLQSEIARLDRNVRMGDAVEKFKAGMVGVDALKKLGIPARSIDQLMFDRKMFLTPDSPAKLDTIFKRRLFQANRGYREQYKRMVRQGASRGDILRMQRAFRENMRRMREYFARQKAQLEQKNMLQNSPRSFASIFGPR